MRTVVLNDRHVIVSTTKIVLTIDIDSNSPEYVERVEMLFQENELK
jgi:hypothetical protein